MFLIDVRPAQACWTIRISFSVAQTTATYPFEESQHVEIARSMRSYFSESKESEVLHRVCRVLTIACVLSCWRVFSRVSFCSMFAAKLRMLFLVWVDLSAVADPQSPHTFPVSKSRRV